MLALFVMFWILFYLFFCVFLFTKCPVEERFERAKNYYIWRKETMKRRLALLLGAAMLTVSLAGCSGGGNSGSANSGNTSGEASGHRQDQF